jgi:hypothetical protein
MRCKTQADVIQSGFDRDIDSFVQAKALGASTQAFCPFRCLVSFPRVIRESAMPKIL